MLCGMRWKNSFRKTNGYIDHIGNMQDTSGCFFFAYVGEHPGNTILLGGGSSKIAYGVCIFAIHRKDGVTYAAWNYTHTHLCVAV